MSIQRPQFPSKGVYDGTADDRGSRTINASPSYLSYDQLVGEVIAAQERILELETGGSEALSAESDETISAGSPIVVLPNGHLANAQNSDPARYRVAGLMLVDVEPSFAGLYTTDSTVSLEDWSPVTGTATLSVGQQYFLSDVIGQLTTTAPTSAGQYVVRVGVAISSSTMAVEVQQPIRL